VCLLLSCSLKKNIYQLLSEKYIIFFFREQLSCITTKIRLCTQASRDLATIHTISPNLTICTVSTVTLVSIWKYTGMDRGEVTHTANSVRFGRQGVRGWSFERSTPQTLIQRAILCLPLQPCSASGARWLASRTTKGANSKCGMSMAGGARRPRRTPSRITRTR
jgi:hypothetical protein